MKLKFKKFKKGNITSFIILAVLVLGIVVALILLGTNQDFRRKASEGEGPVSIFLTPSSGVLDPNDQQEIQIHLNTQDEQINGVQVELNIDGNVPDDIVFIPENVPGLSFVKQELVNSPTGKTLRFAYIASFDQDYTTGAETPGGFRPFSTNNSAVKLATLSFTSLNEGQITLSFIPISTAALDSTFVSFSSQSNLAGFIAQNQYTFGSIQQSPTPTPTVSPSPTTDPGTETPTPSPSGDPEQTPGPTETPDPGIGGGENNVSSFSLSTRFLGVIGNAGEITARVSILNQTTNQILRDLLVPFIFNNGLYSANIDLAQNTPEGSIEEGIYSVFLKGEKHLGRKFINVNLTNGAIFNFNSKPQEPGDVPPQDGAVNLPQDMDKILEAIVSPLPPAGQFIPADLNYDGKVNAIDANLLLQTLTQKGDEF